MSSETPVLSPTSTAPTPPTGQSLPHRPPTLPSSTNASRRASQINPMAPPPLPFSSPTGMPLTPTNSIPFPALTPTHTMETGMPSRHPRQMTPAELHLELEKEQEAMVNRLTRELTALRAHSASVASTASSTSTAPVPNVLGTGEGAGAGETRRARSSSAASQGIMPPMAGYGSVPSGRMGSGAGGAVQGTSRYEEVMMHKAEMEEARRENERLRKRVRELEALVKEKKGVSSPDCDGGKVKEG
ncbi:hypothetical protein EJ06DRAFT_534275 [Trichodelitschia bisporula]|uniref:BZIP domain-containing protein n=1 Tax=Trichodelitschia bisporula TaxID=703511 RepID=A0A6G1HJV0_9PEZI|nr:hypothetical protein EJ06DRAFT_534275 [Trichodelitschia bisporula]